MKNELEEYIKTYFGMIELEELKQISSFFKLQQIEKGEYYLKQGKHLSS